MLQYIFLLYRKPDTPNSSFESSFEDERSVTPTFNSSNNLVEGGEETTKVSIEPKNLMDVSSYEIHVLFMANL